MAFCKYTHIAASASEGQEGALDPLKLELQAAVNHLTLVQEPNSGQGKQVSFASEPPLQPTQPALFAKPLGNGSHFPFSAYLCG